MSKQKRPTSAGYRLPLGNTTSVYRDYSRPKVNQTSSGGKLLKEAEKCDEVAQTKIWREQIHSEWKGVHEWDKNWRFTKDFDPHGRSKTPQKLPEEESFFSEIVSPTQGHVYGSRVDTELGEKMSHMEFMFHSTNRKCKMDKEFICY